MVAKIVMPKTGLCGLIRCSIWLDYCNAVALMRRRILSSRWL